MRADYTEVFQNPTAVEKYDEVQYAADSHSTAVNVRQRRYLRRLVRDAFPTQRPTQHDFACGTGRAVELLHGLVRDAHGYDTSAQMLARAAENGHHAHWHQIEETGPVPTPEPVAGTSIVTVFRLLLNVPDAVRDRSVAFAARALPTYTSGLLVVQNHGSARSLRHLRARRNASNPWFSELSDEQVLELFDAPRVLARRPARLRHVPEGLVRAPADPTDRPRARRLCCARRASSTGSPSTCSTSPGATMALLTASSPKGAGNRMRSAHPRRILAALAVVVAGALVAGCTPSPPIPACRIRSPLGAAPTAPRQRPRRWAGDHRPGGAARDRRAHRRLGQAGRRADPGESRSTR